MGLYHKFYRGQDLERDSKEAIKFGIYVNYEFLVLSVPDNAGGSFYRQVLSQFDEHINEKLMGADGESEE